MCLGAIWRVVRRATFSRELSRWVPGATSFNDRGTVVKFDSDHHIVNHHGRGAKGGAVIHAFRDVGRDQSILGQAVLYLVGRPDPRSHHRCPHM